jgi:hypothetical protein
MIYQCREFAEKSLPTSTDQYARRHQDPAKKERQIIQITNGKLGEELAYACYSPYYPNLTHPDYEVYGKEAKSWDPDLTDPIFGVRVAVKTKDKRDSDAYGFSTIYENTDRHIWGANLDGKALDQNQYICMVSVDPVAKKGQIVACVKLQWLHDNNLFTKPDRDYLSTKMTVRLENMEKVIRDANELWQLELRNNEC